MTKFFRVMCCVLAGVLMISAANVARAQEATFTEAQKAELQTMMKDFLMNNGQTIIESVQKHQEQMMADANKEADDKIAARLPELTAKDLPSTGNPNGDVTVVEFFDYRCGYCHKAANDLVELLKTETNTRFVFLDLPVLGPASLEAAKWSKAAHKQGKFFEYHLALMQNNGDSSEQNFMEIGKTLGLDVEKLKADAGSADVMKSIDRSRELASELAFNGTPGFIINGKPYRGYIGLEGMKQAIAEARSAGAKTP